MLGFRTLLRTHDTPDLLDITEVELARWLRHKRYDSGAITGPDPVEIAGGVLGSVQRHTDDVGSRTMRTRIVENTPKGAWTSELTVHTSPTGNRGWVWLDIHKPDDHGWTATPRLARQLVRALPARDGAHLLNAHPRLVREPDVDKVVAALTDPARRGLAFVAGTKLNTKVEPWREIVESVLDDTEGLANAWVLTPDATERFNYLVQPAHGVSEGFVRTFVPTVDIGNALDGERHRYLSGRSLERGSDRALRRVLGQRAREQMIAARLPDMLRDLDRILRAEIDANLLSQLTPMAPPIEVVAPRRPAEPVTRDIPAPVAEPEQASPAHPLDPVPISVGARLVEMIMTVLGTDKVTVENLARIEWMARAAQQAEPTRARLSERLRQLRDSAEEANFERDLTLEDLVNEQRERANAEEERAEAERRLRHVRKELAVLGRADIAWSEAELDIRDIRPDTFVDLVERLGELPHLAFTGNPDTTLDLDKHGNARSWSGKTWDALLALDDYARISGTGGFAGDVSGYLADTPAECRSFSANRHAATESEAVQNNPKYRRPREFPVPADVEPSGSVFMGAHFKIAQSARVSPRMHYLDATARTGLIYVGYIGPHLPLATS
jgi:hypothetical protein